MVADTEALLALRAAAAAMVLAGDDLGQHLWRALGYEDQRNWHRWVKSLPGASSA